MCCHKNSVVHNCFSFANLDGAVSNVAYASLFSISVYEQPFFFSAVFKKNFARSKIDTKILVGEA
jgi:hypothetical protein